jgi:hypothetical protein
MAITDSIKNQLTKEAPDYENNIKSKMPGFNLILEFPTCPNPDEKKIDFTAFVKSVDDNFGINYTTKKVYGRMDPVPTYEGTPRTIKFDLDIPSNGLAHSMIISDKLAILVKNLYPTYEKSGFVNVISSMPLVRIFFSNLIQGKNQEGLLGFFDSGISIKHDLTKGVFTRKGGFETYPKSYSLSFSFTALHEFTPGYIVDGGVYKNELTILRKV